MSLLKPPRRAGRGGTILRVAVGLVLVGGVVALVLVIPGVPGASWRSIGSLLGSVPQRLLALLAVVWIAGLWAHSFVLSASLPGLSARRALSGVGDFIRDGVNGLLADSDAQMAQLTAWLLGDPDSLGRIRAHNAGTPPSLDWAGVVERGLAVYRAAGAVDSAPVDSAPVGGAPVDRTAADRDQPVRRPDVVLAR